MSFILQLSLGGTVALSSAKTFGGLRQAAWRELSPTLSGYGLDPAAFCVATCLAELPPLLLITLAFPTARPLCGDVVPFDGAAADVLREVFFAALLLCGPGGLWVIPCLLRDARFESGAVVFGECCPYSLCHVLSAWHLIIGAQEAWIGRQTAHLGLRTRGGSSSRSMRPRSSRCRWRGACHPPFMLNRGWSRRWKDYCFGYAARAASVNCGVLALFWASSSALTYLALIYEPGPHGPAGAGVDAFADLYARAAFLKRPRVNERAGLLAASAPSEEWGRLLL